LKDLALFIVIPAKAGIQTDGKHWIVAFAQ